MDFQRASVNFQICLQLPFCQVAITGKLPGTFFSHHTLPRSTSICGRYMMNLYVLFSKLDPNRTTSENIPRSLRFKDEEVPYFQNEIYFQFWDLLINFSECSEKRCMYLSTQPLYSINLLPRLRVCLLISWFPEQYLMTWPFYSIHAS